MTRPDIFSVKGSRRLARIIRLLRAIADHQPANEHLRLDGQGVSPSQVAVRGDTTVPVFELRNECVVPGSHLLRQFALRQTAVFPQLAQPASRQLAQLPRQVVRTLGTCVHVKIA